MEEGLLSKYFRMLILVSCPLLDELHVPGEGRLRQNFGGQQMTRKPKYLIWEYQAYYRDHIQMYATKVFQELSDNLKPSVFLLGISREKDASCHSMCIEPEDCGINLNLFINAVPLGNELYDADPRARIICSMPGQHRKMEQEDLRAECLRDAIKQLADRSFEGQGRISFIAGPVERYNYAILIVLQFEKSIYERFYSLHRTKDGADEKSPANAKKSLVEALVHAYLYEALEPLYKPRPGVYHNEVRTSVKEIFRHAAADFIGTAVTAASGSTGSYDLFDVCNYISSLKYENASSYGKLIVCKEEHPNINIPIRLSRPVALHDHRSVRKLLEISSGDLHLYTNGDYIVGFAELTGHTDLLDKDLFVINFTGSHRWELLHDSHIMMIVEHTNPRLPKMKTNRFNFISTLKRTFDDVSDENIADLLEMVSAATEQRNGALILISQEARDEAARLENQSTLIEPVRVDTKFIKSITSIDGAILLDTSGICHAIGVILDGIATSHGTPARGARYNSAVRYVDKNYGKCVAIIISEDGMVDMYPQLKPQIRKSDIVKHLEQLRAYVCRQKVDYDRCSSIMNWFRDHAFYLSSEECEEVNRLKKDLDSRDALGLFRIRLVYPDLEPDAEMNETYFLEERVPRIRKTKSHTGKCDKATSTLTLRQKAGVSHEIPE
jgi:DNA integrity scanning protein DisA with diadenylate cyclase activity